MPLAVTWAAWHAVVGAEPTLASRPALSIQVASWALLESDLFVLYQVPLSTSTLSFDVAAPPSAHTEWLGEISLFIECPRLDIWNEHVGTVAVPSGEDTTSVRFSVPHTLARALATQHECRLRIGIAAPTTSEPFILDNMRFGP